MMRALSNPGKERQELSIFGFALVAIATGFYFLAGIRILPGILAVLGLVGLLGSIAYPYGGRNFYIIIAIISSTLGRIVSWLVLLFMYMIVIAGFGLLLRAIGMNRLQRNFRKTRKKETMFTDSPSTTQESFLRQS